MIVGIPNKTNLLALPRALKRVVAGDNKPRVEREKTRAIGPFAAFAMMMERQADLVIRQMGE